MIHAVRSDSSTFRDVHLEQGFNVVLADRTPVSGAQDTRNGVGKSTLIDIIHFCLGSGIEPKSALASEKVAEWTFFLDFEWHGSQLTVARSPRTSGHVEVSGEIEALPSSVPSTGIEGGLRFSTANWIIVLGSGWYGLPPRSSRTARVPGDKYQPSFRSLISYAVRRADGGYLSPFLHHPKQAEWDKQVHNAFLLGLDWTDARDWQLLKDRQKELDQFNRAREAGIAQEMLGSLPELQAERVRLSVLLRDRSAALSDFRVHPQYNDLERDATQLTSEIHELTNQLIIDEQLIRSYQAGDSPAQGSPQQDLVSVYREAGVVFGEGVLRRLGSVREFHETVVANRRSFLQAEISRLTQALATRRNRLQTATERRASILRLLQSHGALEEYSALQARHTEIVQSLREVESRIANLTKIQNEQSQIRIDRELLLQRARANIASHQDQRDAAVAAFNVNSEALYSAPGRLLVDVVETGFTFDVDIQRSGSHGIGNMKILCYDLALARLLGQRTTAPGILVHDSMIFDGVDERQIAKSLELAAKQSTELSFQYLCTMNSDTVPTDEFSSEFDFFSHVRMRLTDDSPRGGLLGIRF